MKRVLFHMTDILLCIRHYVTWCKHFFLIMDSSALAHLFVLSTTLSVSSDRRVSLYHWNRTCQEIMLSNQSSKSFSVNSFLVDLASFSTSGFVSFTATVSSFFSCSAEAAEKIKRLFFLPSYIHSTYKQQHWCYINGQYITKTDHFYICKINMFFIMVYFYCVFYIFKGHYFKPPQLQFDDNWNAQCTMFFIVHSN